jgi:aminopeptidase
MTSSQLEEYGRLLAGYCLELLPGDRLLIQTTMLAEPLVREVYRHALMRGAHVDIDWQFRGRDRIFGQYASPQQLQRVNPLMASCFEHYEAYLFIRAPYNLSDSSGLSPAQAAIKNETFATYNKLYFERTADRWLKRNLCQFPTDAAAQEAGLTLEDYEDFVAKACKLDQPDPAQGWLQVRAEQQHIVDYLNTCSHMRYVGPDTDIRFSTTGRTWINSDGRTNMPSGEVYTSPIEDSVEGFISFSYPGKHGGHDVSGVRLEVKSGEITHWQAAQGQDYLNRVFDIPGARRFGEAAIGTNYGITRTTRNILFDEKIGGSVHMAIGQSYLQCGGKNESAIHWDMITDMTKGGQIYADGKLIYENGLFIV